MDVKIDEKYNFNISLSVLNHLGRNLYRNIITVLGEAISNSWDADANNVWIDIDKDKNCMLIKDDGSGMTDDDFQNKFLKIGYSKRRNGVYKSQKGRSFIGRKGIGKLALLSCAERIHIITKAQNDRTVGGIIDNSGLDKAITDDLSSQDYELEHLNDGDYAYVDDITSGTVLIFESLTNGIFNTIDYIRKAIALYFRFSMIDSNFNIYVNGEVIKENMISDLADHTQFLWRINKFQDQLFPFMKNLEENSNIHTDFDIKGYIATTEKPSNLKIRGTQEKVTVDLFVNGRLRERDILRHFPTSRIVENYAYGQIHFDMLDKGDSDDVFTSSREGIISNSPLFDEMLRVLETLFKRIIEEWDDFRRKHNDDGDPDNTSVPKKKRKAQELFNATLNDMGASASSPQESFMKKGSLVDQWVAELAEEAQFNIPSYTECYISENLLRKYVSHAKLSITREASQEAQKWKERENSNKKAANISYAIRKDEDDLFYLDMMYLSCLIDKAPNDKTAGLNRSAIVYKPVRDAVGHTSIVTDTAKQQLNTEYENIKARLVELLKSLSDDDNKQ